MKKRSAAEQEQLDRAFLSAAENLREKEMARLLAEGANPNVRSRWNNEPVICHVAMFGTVEELMLLIQHKVDVNAADITGMTALHAALEQASLDNARLLVEHGADLNFQARPGETPPPWVTALIFDQKHPSTQRTRFILQHAPNFYLRFEHMGKPGQIAWDVLATHEDRKHGAEIKQLVTEYLQEQKRRQDGAEQVARRQQSLKNRRRREGGKYRL